MVPIRRAHVPYVISPPLYYEQLGGDSVVYKPAGKPLTSVAPDPEHWPRRLYVRDEDKLTALQEIQHGVNRRLAELTAAGETEKVKGLLVGVVEESLTEPRSGGLEGLSETVATLASQCADTPEALGSLANISAFDYTTAVHSVNVMALSMAYALANGMNESDTRSLGLAALLHDVGKVEVDPEILKADRRLTEDEVKKMRLHPESGRRILNDCRFDDERIILGALEHHERLDGSGYPRKIKKISQAGQIIGIVDCYEALTTDDRPYRRSMSPFDALSLIKNETDQGKFDQALFDSFVKSLA